MRFNLIFILFLCCTTLTSQHINYELFHTNNEIKVKTRGTTQWLSAKKGMSLGLIDSIHIGSDSEVRILDVRTNEVYRSNTKGYYRVKDIRDAAKKQSTKMLTAVCAQIEGGNTGDQSMKMVGATVRGQSSDFTEDIAQTISFIGKELCNRTLHSSNDLRMTTHNRDGEIYFSFSNRTSKNYCINVVLYNKKTKKASLCYVISPTFTDFPYIILPAQKTIELSMLTFAPPTIDEEYILFATEHIYDSSHLQSILQSLTWNSISECVYENYKVAFEN